MNDPASNNLDPADPTDPTASGPLMGTGPDKPGADAHDPNKVPNDAPPSNPFQQINPPAQPAAPGGLKDANVPATPQAVDDPKPASPGIGGFELSALGGGTPAANNGGNQANPIQLPLQGTRAITLGRGRVVLADPSGVNIDGTRHAPGGAPLTLPNSVFSVVLAGSNNSPGSSDKAPPEEGNTPAVGEPTFTDVITIAGLTVTTNPSGIMIGGSTLVPGGEGTMISGSSVALDRLGNLFVNGKPTPLPQYPPKDTPATLGIGGQAVTPNPAGFFIAGSSVLSGSSAVNVAGISVSLDSSGNLFLNGVPTSLAQMPTDASPEILTVGGKTFTAKPAGFAIGSSSLLPGGSAITISGMLISLASSGVLIVGTSTISMATATPGSNIISAGGQTLRASPTGFQIDGSSVIPGGSPVTVSGTPISFGPSGVLFVGSSRITLSPQITPSSNIFSIGSQTFTANPTGFVVGGSTLSPGGNGVIVSGTSVSLGPSGILIMGSSTINLLSPTQASASGISGSGMGGLDIIAQGSTIVVDGTTLTPGGADATIDGQLVSDAGGGSVVIGTRTVQVTGYGNNSSKSAIPFQGNQPRRFTISRCWLIGWLLSTLSVYL